MGRCALISARSRQENRCAACCARGAPNERRVTLTVPTAAMRWRCSLGYVQGVDSGVDSLHTTRPSTAVGSIRRRWRFPCSLISARGRGASPRSTSFAAKRRHGRSGPIASSSGFAGDSPCRRPERSSITNPQTSPGQRTRSCEQPWRLHSGARSHRLSKPAPGGTASQSQALHKRCCRDWCMRPSQASGQPGSERHRMYAPWH